MDTRDELNTLKLHEPLGELKRLWDPYRVPKYDVLGVYRGHLSRTWARIPFFQVDDSIPCI
jgi:hypothetical protein